ncbi:hypothetical protein [Vibrio parahaemolyticus]|uniref:hypothetical protein n=1 Tax=Vibrio parahaemolyticus TaxID=670 RepID=UPI002361028E|nr:hypothetical protein [Vibrio parahaemolyticus]
MKSDEEVIALIGNEWISRINENTKRVALEFKATVEKYESAQTKEEVKTYLEQWLNESHHPDVFYSEFNATNVDYGEFRFVKSFFPELDEWNHEFKTHCQSVGVDTCYDDFASDLSHDLNCRFINLRTLLNALFFRAEELQAFDLLADYLRAQIKWMENNKFCTAVYSHDDGHYGSLAAIILMGQSLDHLPLYLDYLKAVPTDNWMKTDISDIDELTGDLVDKHGFSEITYPLIEAQVTYALNEHGLEAFSEWCENGLVEWLTDNNKIDTLLAAEEEWFKKIDNLEDLDDYGVRSILNEYY